MEDDVLTSGPICFDRIRRVMDEKRYEKYPKNKLAVT